MKKYSPLLFLSTTILFNCCEKNSGITNRYDNVVTDNPTSYLLVSEDWSGPSTNGESISFFYNDQNLVTKIGRYQWGTYSVNGGPLQTWYDSSYSYYEYTDGLATKITSSENGGGSYIIYVYNNDRLPIERIIYDALG